MTFTTSVASDVLMKFTGLLSSQPMAMILLSRLTAHTECPCPSHLTSVAVNSTLLGNNFLLDQIVPRQNTTFSLSLIAVFVDM
jgi:hypothetical protein